MQADDHGIPAWLTCEEIINKIRTELITQAMDTLDEAVAAKAIEVKGSLINLPDKSSETEMKMFVIRNLIDEKEKIAEMYKSYLSDIDAGNTTQAKLEQKERLEKFLLYVEKISVLMDYSNVIEQWIHDIGMEVSENDPSLIIKKSIAKEKLRKEILGYVLKNKTMIKEEVLDSREMEIIRKAVQMD